MILQVACCLAGLGRMRNPDRWKVTNDGWLQIMGEDGSVLSGQPQSNMLFRELPAGNFMITAHLTTAPDSNFQQTAIFLYRGHK